MERLQVLFENMYTAKTSINMIKVLYRRRRNAYLCFYRKIVKGIVEGIPQVYKPHCLGEKRLASHVLFIFVKCFFVLLHFSLLICFFV